MFGNPEAQRGPRGAGKGRIESHPESLQSRPSLKQARQGAEGHGTRLQVNTHPMGIRQSLAFSLSTKREVIFPGFPLSARDIDSTLRRRKRGSLGLSQGFRCI